MARTNINKTTPATAKEAYQTCRKDIDRLLGWLRLELDRHHASAKAKPQDWGLAGDLATVRCRLVETLAFISGEEIEDVVAELSS